MKVAVVIGKGQVVIEEIPKPKPRRRQLLLKVLYCSICGRDVEKVYSQDWDVATPDQLAVMKGAILGHEYIAAVEAIGEEVTSWKIGDRAVLIHDSCGNCFYCRRGMNELCLGGRVRGYPADGTLPRIPGPPREGALAEYIVRPVRMCLRVPASVPDQDAAMTEPLATGVTAVLNSGVQLGDAVAVIGVGHVGLMVLAAAKAAGAAPLIAIDIKHDRLNIATQMGANYVIDASKADPINEAVKITEAGPDIAFVCTSFSAKGVVEQAFEMVRYHGRVMIIGGAAPAILDSEKWMRKEVRVEGTVHQCEEMIRALNLIESKRVDVKPTISEVVPLEQVQRAFEALYTGKNVAVLMKP
jgi:threonine dehydrogenase-like Zn-dependent dehydrogenase